eukprot:gnl/TRDRNA2_/TRDRNA2_186787_c0_seq1.p1 gnl/TRDRNA2_/TRDRNA2_186787_c0~~gnl/TRDRNA2_/TRDRNA2_186787_c0_seq1.p1  ORF type:complete len:622 (+),score=83.17 gnl/TRDRNA2_/TRDRNA2_186787_c0_seq1:48-1868(+)
MDVPLAGAAIEDGLAMAMEPVDEMSAFFLADTSLRLGRVIELALAYGCFAVLLYVRFLCPGGYTVWSWMEPEALWVVVFFPLFCLDCRNFSHVKYLRRYRDRLAAHDAERFLLICASESIYKIMLCIHLMFRGLRQYLTLRVVMIPYTAGYVLHFVLGHFVPLEDGERAEGCNAVSSLLSELARFLQFVLIVSLSLKVDNVSNVVYDWQAAFWPCWGLEGIVFLVVTLLLPVCLVSALVDRPRMLMLSWVVISGTGLGVASFVSMWNISILLDKHLCPSPPDLASRGGYVECLQRLEWSLWPWLAFLPCFAVCTMLMKARLALALHDAWYQPPQTPPPEARPQLPPPPISDLPPPRVMFRITPTYYSRTCSPSILHSDSETEAGNTPARGSMTSQGSMTRVSGVVDPDASILSARGADLDIVESEQLCFVCYACAPDAVLLECGHAGLCVLCATELMERRQGQAVCPICRNLISNVMKLRAEMPLPADIFLPKPRSKGDSLARSLILGATGRSLGPVPCDAEYVETSMRASASSSRPTAAEGCTHSPRGGDVSPTSTSRDSAAAATTPTARWPHSARRSAVMVEVARRNSRGSSSWSHRLSSFLRG